MSDNPLEDDPVLENEKFNIHQRRLYHRVFGTEAGQWVLNDILSNICGYRGQDGEIYLIPVGEPLATAENVTKKNVAMMIEDRATAPYRKPQEVKYERSSSSKHRRK